MKAALIASGVTLAAVALGGVGLADVTWTHNSRFQQQVTALESNWNRDVSQGVPTTQIAALRSQLASAGTPNEWYSPYWVTNTGQPLLSRLSASTQAMWQQDMTAARSRATTAATALSAYVSRQRTVLPASASTALSGWQQSVAHAASPTTLNTLASQWTADLATEQLTAEHLTTAHAAAVANRNVIEARYSSLLTHAVNSAATASQDNLAGDGVSGAASALRTAINGGRPTAAAAATLTSDLSSLDALIALNNRVSGRMRPLLWLVDQAAAEGTPGAAALRSSQSALATTFAHAQTTAQLDAVTTAAAALTTRTNTALAADVCGHSVGAGKVITVNLTLQEAVFYDNGCVANATPVTTGREDLRTPTGTFHVFYKTSPFEMISPWPTSSPFWYEPTWVQHVLEFDDGGYFLHDAYWEPPTAFGPGSENGPSASHGCIHIPTPMMDWLYTWTPTGTPVVVSA